MLSLLSPTQDIFRIHQGLGDLFHSKHLGGLANPAPSFVPAVDVYEEEDQFVIRADLPGLKEDDIDLQLHAGQLTIAGKREAQSHQNQEGGWHGSGWQERGHGSFRRSFRLGPSVSAEGVDASYDNGVLTVRLPKRKEALPQQIRIQRS